jgi:hypothetical protein
MLDQRTAFAVPDRAVLDVCGRRRSPATFPEFHRGRKPKNAGQKVARVSCVRWPWNNVMHDRTSRRVRP